MAPGGLYSRSPFSREKPIVPNSCQSFRQGRRSVISHQWSRLFTASVPHGGSATVHSYQDKARPCNTASNDSAPLPTFLQQKAARSCQELPIFLSVLGYGVRRGYFTRLPASRSFCKCFILPARSRNKRPAAARSELFDLYRIVKEQARRLHGGRSGSLRKAFSRWLSISRAQCSGLEARNLRLEKKSCGGAVSMPLWRSCETRQK